MKHRSSWNPKWIKVESTVDENLNKTFDRLDEYITEMLDIIGISAFIGADPDETAKSLKSMNAGIDLYNELMSVYVQDHDRLIRMDKKLDKILMNLEEKEQRSETEN